MNQHETYYPESFECYIGGMPNIAIVIAVIVIFIAILIILIRRANSDSYDDRKE